MTAADRRLARALAAAEATLARRPADPHLAVAELRRRLRGFRVEDLARLAGDGPLPDRARELVDDLADELAAELLAAA